MKKIKSIILISLLFTITVNSQIFKVNYLYNPSSGNCIQEEYQIQFKSYRYNRVDYYNDTRIWSPSKLASSGYNDQDLYYEVWSPKFYLDMVGIDEYNRVYHYLVKVIYDKRGGEVLYIMEQDLDSRDKRKRYFITELGSKYFCEN